MPRDIDTPDAPGCDAPDPVYGRVIRSFGNLHFRKKDKLWAISAGPQLIATTYDRERVKRYLAIGLERCS